MLRCRPQYKMTVCNPGNPPWPTPDDRGDWLSDEADPQAVVSDGQWVFLGTPGCELGYSVIGLDETGQRRWGIRVPIQSALRFAGPGGRLSQCALLRARPDRHHPSSTTATTPSSGRS